VPPIHEDAIAGLRHVGLVWDLNALRAMMSSDTELVLGPSHDETFGVELMNELTMNFWRSEELCSQLEGPGMRIYGLLLGPPSSQDRWADRLDKAALQLYEELVEWLQVDAELEALWTSGALVRDLVLGGVDGPS
jgi:hypothetical protein